ncbi:hypothetical protein MMC34_003651 [Xylographa carneopallida]|nr:hypothetical protein [Xylographa carneopallida]
MASPLLFDTAQPPHLNVNTGPKAHLFRPPNTPSTSYSLHHSSTESNNYSDDTVARKRPRNDSLQSGQSTPSASTTGARSNIPSGPSSAIYASGIISPPPFVSTRYRFAGGLDTPSAALASGFDPSSSTPDFAFGRGGRNDGSRHTPEDYFGDTSSALARERNGRSRTQFEPQSRDGWGKAVVSAVSGVAGKVWEFCKAGAFHGFYAGGSHGQSPPPLPPSSSSLGIPAPQSSILQDLSPSTSHIFDAASHPHTASLPGGFPDADFLPEYMSHPSKRPRPSPSSSWVLVPSHACPSRETSPSRLAARKLPSSASTPSARHPASRAGLRRPALPASRPSLTYSPSATRPASSASTRSPLPSPKRRTHHRAHSYGTDGGADGYVAESQASPISIEAQKFAARARWREKEEERALQGFNERLRAMIREGKQALGTRVEVEMEEVDGGGDGEDY